MRLSQWISTLSATVALTATAVAGTVPAFEQLQMPRCLAEKLSPEYRVLAENQDFRIVEVPGSAINSIAKLADSVHCGRFKNVSPDLAGVESGARLKAAKALLSHKAAPKISQKDAYSIQNQQLVNATLTGLDSEFIWKTLTTLSDFYNRSATKPTGVEAANWIKTEFERMAAAAGRNDTATWFVQTGSYVQPSVVTVIGKDINAPAVVIGAHMDTLDGRKPGAGDDGSGSSSVMEVARVLLGMNTTFKRPVYIIWYAAEERGLVGSTYVVRDFKKKAIPVRAAIQFDMTGFRNDQNDRTMWVYRDHTDRALSDYVAELIKTYIQVPVDYSKCGYGCSDHASWDDAGVPAAFPCETSFDEVNPNIHTSNDLKEYLNLDHMSNFARLGVAFAIELANS